MNKTFCFEDWLGAVDPATASLLEWIATTASRRGEALYVVGGPIRDKLLERPILDLDLMLEGDVEALGAALAEEAGADALRVVGHSRFGTLRVESDEAHIDVARLRHETYAQPGALPEVEAGSLEQDVARRDFTINALVCPLDPGKPNRGRAIEDRVGGLEDLAARRLRVLHERSFHDDPTRAWRAARFSARLGFSLERRSRGALRDALRDGAFSAVSGERFRRELQLGFEEAERGVNPARFLRLLSDWHVLSALEPGLVLGRDRSLPLRRLGRAVAAPEWVAPRWRPWIAGLAIWLAPWPAAMRRRTLERFAIRGSQASRIVAFGRDVERQLRGLARARGRGAVDAMLGDLSEEIVQALYACADAAVRRRILRWGAEDRRRRSPVGGRDLREAGLEGPDVGRALARIRAGFLDGEIANREEGLALALELARRSSRRSPRRTGGGRKRSKVARGGGIVDTPPGDVDPRPPPATPPPRRTRADDRD